MIDGLARPPIGLTLSGPTQWQRETLLDGGDRAVDIWRHDHQVIDVELMRRGIRKRGVFGLVGSV